MDKYFVVGALGEVGAHLSLSHVLKYTVGTNYVAQFKDANGKYIWGIGADNLINAAIGSGLYVFGRYKDSENLKSMGEGWLLAFGITKISELWLYFTAIDPIPETPMLSKKAQVKTMSVSSPLYAVSPAQTGSYRVVS